MYEFFYVRISFLIKGEINYLDIRSYKYKFEKEIMKKLGSQSQSSQIFSFKLQMLSVTNWFDKHITSMIIMNQIKSNTLNMLVKQQKTLFS